jgi:cytochrome c peroxidase
MVLRLLSKIQQLALAQFISIQSFDSKYDAGRVLAANDGQVFANFTQENQGKNLF